MICCFLFVSATALAQNERNTGSVEGRIGVLSGPPGNYLGVGGGKTFSGGIGFSFYPTHKSDNFTNRFSFRGSFDFARLGTNKTPDRSYRFSENLAWLNAGFGYSVVNNSRFELTPHFGASFIRDGFSISTFNPYYGQWRNICRYLDNYCHGQWTVYYNAGVSARYFPKKDNRLFLGFDYDRAGKWDHKFFTIGVKF